MHDQHSCADGRGGYQVVPDKYPFPIPRPVYRHTRCGGAFLSERLPQEDHQELQPRTRRGRYKSLPVSKFFIEQKINLMTADALLAISKRMKQRAMDVSETFDGDDRGGGGARLFRFHFCFTIWERNLLGIAIDAATPRSIAITKPEPLATKTFSQDPVHARV